MTADLTAPISTAMSRLLPLARMSRGPFKWAIADSAAIAILTGRLEAYAKLGRFITYSQLVSDVNFKIYPNQDYFIDVEEWHGLDRTIIGEYLAWIIVNSYRDNGIMLSTICVTKRGEQMPGFSFFTWMQSVRLLEDLSEESILGFWATETKKVFNFYKKDTK